eukprot:731161_1
MEQFIKFRLQADTLSLDEYRCFICNVLNESNLQEFSSMIFNHLHQKWKKQTEEQPSNGLQIHQINHEISSIVSQRQMNETEADSEDATNDKSPQPEPTQTNIHHQTDVVIQEIASYLPFKSYSNFQSCCRSIFYAANTPSTLYELDGNMNFADCINTENEYQIKRFMKQFERVQRLTVDPNVKYVQLVQFRNLKHLILSSVDAIEPYLSNDTFNWNEIRTLDISGNLNNTLEIIKRCQNLSTLILDEIDDNQNQLAELVGSMLNLQCLVLAPNAAVDARVLLKNLCNTLQSLTLFPSLCNIDGMTFHNLVELQLLLPTPNDIILIVKSTKHLKRLILMYPECSSVDFSPCFRTIFELDTLEYCCLTCSHESFLALTRLVETTFHQKRDALKLKLNVTSYQGQPTPDDIHVATLRIFNTLHTWCARDFMVVVEICARNNDECKELTALNRWLNDISKTDSVHTDKIVREGKQTFIISNKGSSFNGYTERLLAPDWHRGSKKLF